MGNVVLIDESLVGKPKGIKWALHERGLWKEGLGKQCGAKSKEGIGTDAQFNVRKELDR